MYYVIRKAFLHAIRCRSYSFTIAGRMEHLLLINCNKCHTTLAAQIAPQKRRAACPSKYGS